MNNIPAKPDLGEKSMPQHVAFIMDGNGRWAQARKLARTEGHRQGVERVEDILDSCREWGIKYATLYAFSTENWNRPDEEIDVLFSLMVEYLELKIPRFLRDDVRLHVIGDTAKLPEKARAKLEESLQKTAHCQSWHVLLAVNYGGRDELIRATQKMIEENVDASQINEELFSDYLDTKDMPDPDLMIRTSGEQRISNFLLWQLAYSEFIFVNECWPEFTPEIFHRTLQEYGNRDRRFGLTGEQAQRS